MCRLVLLESSYEEHGSTGAGTAFLDMQGRVAQIEDRGMVCLLEWDIGALFGSNLEWLIASSCDVAVRLTARLLRAAVGRQERMVLRLSCIFVV